MKHIKGNGGLSLRRSAGEAKRYSVVMKIMKVLLGVIVSFTAIIYIISILYSKYGSFTVTVNKFDGTNYGISLCEDPQFENPMIRLNAKACEDATNISESWLPADLDQINGSHNGDDYMAYTFYCKNTGSMTVDYEYYLYLANVTNRVDTASRIRFYVDGEPVTYAKTASDGSGPEPGTTAFLSNTGVVRGQIHEFHPGDITKYTVVIWIEGDDPDCTNDLLGGSIKSDMSISVVKVVTDDDDKG